jgi:PTH1 family peptidyl-tRNA hydrolase
MYLVVFLGNPGSEYAHTRHNAGWIVADEIFSDVDWKMDKYANAEIAKIEVEVGDDTKAVLLAKPQTFMNNSGDTVKYLAKEHELQTQNIIVVYDDIDVPLGGVKLSAIGKSNHNGIRSVISKLGTEDFVRIRVGIGGGSGPLHDYVLGRLAMDEEITLQNTALGIQKVIKGVVRNGIVLTQNGMKKVLG